MGFFTLTGVITDFTPYPVARFAAYQVILEPVARPQVEGSSLYSTIAVGRIDATGHIVASDGTSPFQAWTEDGLLYAFRTLPELFTRVVFDAPADGTTLPLSGIAGIETVGTMVPFPVPDSIESLINDSLVSAKAYADSVAGSGFVGVGTNKITVGLTEPTVAVEGDLWLDTSP